MILKGSQRGGAKQLARHLLKTQENEHVEVHELRGFIADDLTGALREAHAVSQATRCRQFVFHLSLSPPPGEVVPVHAFENALDRIETKLGLEGQPRAIVFHEKEGRRHAHCVWSRIDGTKMKAINLPHFKVKLRDISRELYLEHRWKMPRGLMNSRERNPLNFSLAEWQQAARLGEDPKSIKAALQECWAVSDSRKAFAKALEERGFYLAQGDRRGFVAVDYRGEVFGLARAAGVKTKEMRARLGDSATLPTVAAVKANVARQMSAALEGYIREASAASRARFVELARARRDLAQRHRDQRAELRDLHERRWNRETMRRAERMSRGLRGVWDRLTGKYARLRRENEIEAFRCYQRDAVEKDRLVELQLEERRSLQQSVDRARAEHAETRDRLRGDIAHYMQMEREGAMDLGTEFRAAQDQGRHLGGPGRGEGLEPEP
ncbi:MAG: relaxase/mobilization nuclease domain-containing protein [Rhodospirillaceae bacterium]|nr:relaxase/mobilization nuclease domain-containing protein [Rhodospirillaceae bacterium]